MTLSILNYRRLDCDQRFISKGDSSGVIYSPNYPSFKEITAICQYIFVGLNDKQYFETVKLKFHSNYISKTLNLVKKYSILINFKNLK